MGLQTSTSKDPFWPISHRIEFTWNHKIFDPQIKITRHIANILYPVALQGRGVVIIAEVRGTNMSNLAIIIITIIGIIIFIPVYLIKKEKKKYIHNNNNNNNNRHNNIYSCVSN